MSEAMKPTPGPLNVQPDNKWPFYIKTFDKAGDCVFSEGMPAYSTSQKSLSECLAGKHMGGDKELSVRFNAVAIANAELRAEAHNVLTTTGLSPMQLVERVKELEDALSGMVEFFAPYAWGSQENRSDALAAASAALAKSQGENT